MKKFILSVISVLMLITSVPVYAEDNTTSQETQEETYLEHEYTHDSNSDPHDAEQHNDFSEDEGEIIIELDNDNLQLQSPQFFCNKEEHAHNSDCYSHYKVLICENNEEGHVHTDECFQNYSFLICNQEEHIHTENCYDENYQEPEIIKEESSELETLLNKAINNEDGYYLSCNKQEHKHTPECFQETIELICQRKESFEEENYHQHSDECYDRYYLITCNNEEHAHDFECIEQESQEFGEYIDEIPDDIPADAEIPEDAPLVQMLRGPLRGSNDKQIYVRSLFVQVFKGGSWQDDKYVKTVPNSATGQRFAFRINFALSGVGEIDPYDVENPQEGVKIVVPKQILRNRLGDLANSYEMSIPHISEIYDEELDPEIYYCYYEEDDNIVIVNFRERPAGDNGYIEMAFSTTQTTFNYEDMCKSDDFFATIYATNNGEEVEQESNHIPVYINTTARITSTYKQYPTKYDTWRSSWGVEPSDADDYFYLVWQIRSNIDKDSSQPYNLTFTDTTVSQQGASEFVAYKFRGESEWTANNTVINQTITGDRYDSVLTRHLKSDFDPLNYWLIKNKIEIELIPADGLDTHTNVSSTNEYKYQYHAPIPHIPVTYGVVGGFWSNKYSDGSYRSRFGRNILDTYRYTWSRYDLQDFKSGDLDYFDGFDWGVELYGNPYPWTILSGEDVNDLDKYGAVPVEYIIEDKTFFLGTQNTRQLTYEDYEITDLHYTLRDTRDATASWTTYSNGDKRVTYSQFKPNYNKESDVVFFYVESQSSGEFVLAATHDLKDDNIWFNEEYVDNVTFNNEKGVINFKSNITGYKITFENAYYYTDIENTIKARLKHSEYIDNYLANNFTIIWGNTADTKVIDKRNNSNAWSATRTDFNYATETIVERHSILNKRTTSATNITKKRLYEIGWKIDMYETIKINEDPKEYVIQESGIFYDLLPAGSTFNPNSISVKSGSTYLKDNEYKVSQIPNYRDTGRILLTVEILTETSSTYEMYYTTTHPWDSIKDFGEHVYNPVAYETGNPQIYNGRKNDGGSLGETMANLGVNGNTEPKFLYSSSTHNILALTSAISGLTKKVKNDSDKNYTYDTTTKNNGAYSYRLRYQTTFGNTAKNLIFFDSLENYVVDSNASDWYGTIESFDVAQLRAKGIEPVIYLSEVTNFDLEQYNVYTDFNDVFLNNGDWVRIEDFGDLSRAKAFAIDCRKKTDGSEFVLGESESIQAVVYMRAPAGADDINGTGIDYPETYNNIYIRNTVTGIDGEPQDFYIHQDYTTVRFVVKNDISLEKVSSEDSETKLKDIKFRLTGKSDYGTEIDEIKTTDKFGKITFEEIEKGRYILQEYETTKDWLLDTTEHIVVIDSEGKVFVNEQEIADSYILLENDPRIYADVPLQKRREGDGADDIELKQLLAAAEVDSEVECNGKTYKILEKTASKVRVKEVPQGEAYAVYDSSDETVTFFRDAPSKYRHKQTEGSKTYYTGIETTNYTGLNNPPWFSYGAFRTIILKDVISPISTSYWFARSLEIIGLDKLDTSNVTNMSYMFDNSRATLLDLSNFDTSNVTDMTEMFSESRATSLDLSSFDTSKVTDMYSMFSFSMATSLDLSSFDTSSVTNMGEMFYNSQATSLDLSSFDTSNVTYMSSMFVESQASSLDLSSFNTSKVTDMEYMFTSSSSLFSIYVSNLWSVNNTTSSYNMFYECANLPNYNSSYVDKTRANYNEGGYLTYKAYTPSTPFQSNQAVEGYWLSTEFKPQTPIANTTFKLSGTSDYGNETIQILTTNTAGKLVFEEIEQGTYELVEVSPNEDFILNETKWIVTIGEDRSVSITSKEEDRDRLYEIGEDEGNTFKTIYNEPRYWGFTLRKIDKENTSIWLEGATFILKGISDLGTNYDLEVNSDANGRVVFDRIEKGTYLLKETIAPANVNENGQVGGNRNYIADSKQYIVEIDCFGNVKIDGLNQNEYDDFEVKNDRALDGKITIIKKWEDNKDPDGRPTPVVHLSTGEPEGLSRVQITYDANGGYFENNNSSINRVVYKGNVVDETFVGELVEGEILEPVREGSVFDGWYLDKDRTIPYTEDISDGQSKKVYAKWNRTEAFAVYDSSNETVTFFRDEPGKYTNNQVDGTKMYYTGIETTNYENDPPWYKYKGYRTFIIEDVISPISTYYWFAYSSDIIGLDKLDTSKVTSMSGMFKGSQATTLDLSSFNTSNVIYMSNMFMSSQATSLDLSSFDTSNVTIMYSMFGASRATTLNLTSFDTSNVTNMVYMFSSSKATSLDLSSFNTINVTYMSSMFSDSQATIIEGLDKFNTSNVTTMEAMFSESKATTLDLSSFDTTNVTNMASMFKNSQATTIYISDLWNVNNVTSSYNMFTNCTKLPNFNSSYVDKTRARYNTGGYLTYKPAPTVNDITNQNLLSSKPEKLENLLERLGLYTKVYAEDGDIASGVYDNVNWRITADGELIIGKEGETQTFTNRSSRMPISYPWYSQISSIRSVKFVGTVKGGGSMERMFEGFKATSIDLSNFDTSNVTNMSQMFYASKATTIIGLNKISTSNVTNMKLMFASSAATSLDLSNFDTSKVTNMTEMFSESRATSINLSNFDTSNINNMNHMFAYSQATSLDLSSFDTSNVTDMSYMFFRSKAISLDLSSFDTSNVTNMLGMFWNSQVTSLDLSSFNTSNVTDMNSMFYGSQATSINLSSFDTSKVADMNSMFRDSKAKTIIFSNSMTGNNGIRFRNSYLAGEWIKTNDKNGNRLYDQTVRTGTLLRYLNETTSPTLSGTWMNKSVLDPISNPDGTYTWTTVDLLWTDNGDGTWTYTFDVFDDNLTYYFWEEDLEGYESDIEWIPGYKVLDGSKEKIGYITNRSTEFGSLKIEKEVEWYENPRENLYFDFNIQLEGNGIEGRQVFSDVIFNDGYARVKLKDGESVLIQGLPDGVTYSVEEIERSDFTTMRTGDSGTIESQVVKEAKFVNSEVPYETLASSTQVTLRKQIVGIENQENYTFYVEFTNLAKNTTYYVSNGDSFTSDANGYAFYEATLSSGAEITFDEIPYEATYQITETAGDYISSFEILEHLSVSQGSNSNSQVNKQLSTAKETLNIGDSPIVVFTNTFETKQNLKIKKEVVGIQEDKLIEYELTIELEDLIPGKTIESDAGRFVADEDGYSIKTITLKDGEEFNIYELPLSASYKVTESANNCYASYEISDTNNSNSIQKQFDINGEVNKSLSTDYEIVDMGEDVTIKFVNYSQVTLKLIKKVDGNMGDKSAKFNFDIELNIPEIFEGKIEDLQIIESKDLSHDEFVEYKIPYGTEYTVSEDDYSSQGYKTYINNGLMQSRELTDELKKDTEVIFKNVNGVVIPTGIKIFTAIPLASIIALGIFLTRKKKERD